MAEVIIGALAAGFIIGLIPYFVGKHKGDVIFGIIGLTACVIANFIAGLYASVPICIVMVLIILFKK